VTDHPARIFATRDFLARRVSRDGSAIGTAKPHWIGTPHFYRQGRLLVLYLGDEKRIIQASEGVLGRQFAGQ